MKILVTGGAGFIGSHLVDKLLANGDDVVVIDNLTSGKKSNVDPRVRIYEMDIRAPDLKDLMTKEKPRLVYHLAAQTTVSKSVVDPVMDNQINVSGSLNVITSCVEAGVEKLVYASSSAAYGHPDNLPVTETHIARPLSPYGVSKHTVEHYLEIYHKLFDLSYTILRYANVYGPRQNPAGEGGVVAIFADRMLNDKNPVIFGDGSKTRDYIYVSDIVAANLLAAKQESCDVFNIGTGRKTSDDTIFDLLARSCRYQGIKGYAPERLGDIKHMYLDCTKAQHHLKWLPETSLETGIDLTVAYYSGTSA
ncbi:MAG: NAD-dependent epimerase/dehydratase family protein [Dehalogenimonas sp.]